MTKTITSKQNTTFRDNESLQKRYFYFRTFNGPLLRFLSTFYSAYELKCAQKADFWTIKSSIVKISLQYFTIPEGMMLALSVFHYNQATFTSNFTRIVPEIISSFTNTKITRCRWDEHPIIIQCKKLPAEFNIL